MDEILVIKTKVISVKRLLVFALSMPLLAACVTVSTSHQGSVAREVVLSDLKSPWGMAFIDAKSVLITEKEGGLVLADLATGTRLDVAGLPSDIFEDIRGEVPFDNSGLFDVALDSDFAQDPWVYLSYSAAQGDGLTTKVVRAMLVDGALFNTETLLVAEPFTQGEFFHYGGGLAFGADGKLYVTVGERIFNETAGPPLPIAQDVSDRRGKIYRINRDGSIPADNPEFGEGAVPGLFAIGIRASQGIALKPDTGELWFSEHGSRQGDEINRLVAGANYGWPIVTTGGYRNDNYAPPPPGETAFQSPEWSWPQTVAPTGLAFYSGAEFPEWRGDLFVSGLSLGSFWRFDFEGGRIVGVEEMFVNDRKRSRDVAMAPDGSLYMLTDTLLVTGADGRLQNTEQPSGALLRIVIGIR
ncbi:MAG: PQQ-dependent sugar dehydrogenase [Pseudomonadota bacterium]